MSIIQGMREFISRCPFISDLSGGAHVDFTSEAAGSCGVFPTGDVLVETFFDGGKLRQYNFALYARRYTPEDVERLENSEFVERFTQWIEEKNDGGDYPALPDGMEAEQLTCDNGMLFDLDESGETGLYQIQCHLVYQKR